MRVTPACDTTCDIGVDFTLVMEAPGLCRVVTVGRRHCPPVPMLVTGNRTLGCGADAGQGPALGARDLLVS